MMKDLTAVFNMFLDPAAAMERIDSKWIWTIPLGLLSIVSIAVALLITPITARVLLRNPPEGATREQMQQSVAMMEKFSGVSVALAPIMVILTTLLLAALLLAACQVLGLDRKFKELFNLVSMASIVKVLGALAAFAVLKLKGDDIQTMQELSPSLGLDILLPEDANRFLHAFLNFFSVFEIWFVVVLALGLAALAKTSKGKAFAAITPVWLLPLLMAIGGAIFRR